MTSSKNNPLQWAQLILLVGLALFLSAKILQPFFEVLVLSVILTVVFQPLHKKILSRVKSPSWSSLLSVLVVFFTILIPITLLVFAIIPQLTGMADQIQDQAQAVLTEPEKTERVRKFLTMIGQRLHINMDQSMVQVKGFVAQFSKVVLQKAVVFVGGTISLLMNACFLMFSLFYFFRDGKQFASRLVGFLPLDDAKCWDLLERARMMIEASVYGVLVIAIIQGVLGGMMFAFLGISASLVWGLVMVLLSIIPVAGAGLVWIPAVIFLGVAGMWGKAIILALWGTLIIGTVDNFLRPHLVSGKTKTHELMVFFSVLGGLQFFGLLGFLLGPTLLSLTLALLDIVKPKEA